MTKKDTEKQYVVTATVTLTREIVLYAENPEEAAEIVVEDPKCEESINDDVIEVDVTEVICAECDYEYEPETEDEKCECDASDDTNTATAEG